VLQPQTQVAPRNSPFEATSPVLSIKPFPGIIKWSCVLIDIMGEMGAGTNAGLFERTSLKISQKGLYALQAMMALARHYPDKTVKIRDVASEENLPEKFLELILLELRNARMVESVRGAKGGYRLRRPPSDIPLSAIMRLIDGPLAPFADADHLRSLIARDVEHRALYQVFLDVRDAAAKILDNTTVADLIEARKTAGSKPKSSNTSRRKGAAPQLA